MFIFQRISSNPTFKWSASSIALIFLIFLGIKDSPEYVSFTNAYSFFQVNLKFSGILALFLSLAFAYLIYIRILKINQDQRFTEKLSFILAISFFLVFFSNPDLLYHTSIFVVAILLVESLKSLLEIHSQKSVFKLIFKSSILASMASLIFFPSSLFLLIIFGSIIIFRTFDVKNFIVALIAWSLPYYYLFGLDYLLDFNLQIPFPSIFDDSFFKPTIKPLNPGALQFIIYGGLGIIAALAMFSSFATKQKLIVRKRNQISIIFYATLLFTLLSFTNGLNHVFGISFFLGSILIGLYYHSLKKKWLIESFLILLLLLSILSHFFT